VEASRTFLVTPFPVQAVRLRFVDVESERAGDVACGAFLAGSTTKAWGLEF
jgi:hypothetical protein